jgi:hypothetical protein
MPLLVQAYTIFACQFIILLLVVAKEAQVENPCLICPDGVLDPLYAPYVYKDPITCKELMDNAKLFENGSSWCARYEDAALYCCPTTPEVPCTPCPNGITVTDDYDLWNSGSLRTCEFWLDTCKDFDADSAWCTVGWGAYFKSHCCPTVVANNPCTICPDGAITMYHSQYDCAETCTNLIEAALTFDAESEMCLVLAKDDEAGCCSSKTAEFNECNICPDGSTVSVDFQPWSDTLTCQELIEKAKLHEMGSKGCNFHKGYELSCCPGAGTVVENPDTQTHTDIDTTSTPSISIASISPTITHTHTDTTISPSISSTSSETSFAPTSSATPPTKLYIVEVIAAIVGSVTGLVGAAFAFVLWKQNHRQHQHQQQQ